MTINISRNQIIMLTYNKQTASFYPNLTKSLKIIINDIAEKILKEGQPIVIVGDYGWYKEILSLFAKQL